MCYCVYVIAAILVIISMKEHISLYTFNATSISGVEKLTSFNTSFSGKCYDVIAVQETWFHDGILDAEILHNCEYDIHRRDPSEETSVKDSGRWCDVGSI